jgi:hypothetical protein
MTKFVPYLADEMIARCGAAAGRMNSQFLGRDNFDVA